MANRAPIANDEWYHCYNRGVDKRTTFEDEDDYERFLLLLYICNDIDSKVHIADLAPNTRLGKLLLRSNSSTRSSPLVDIAAYSLMPNHVHFVMRQCTDQGLSRFMQKIFTGYTMYFNQKHERTGSLFAGTYKSKHLDSDEYFKHAIQYVNLNPVELFEPDWKIGRGNVTRIATYLEKYPYASTSDFFGTKRPETALIYDVKKEYFDRNPTLSCMLLDAREYYRECTKFLER